MTYSKDVWVCNPWIDNTSKTWWTGRLDGNSLSKRLNSEHKSKSVHNYDYLYFELRKWNWIFRPYQCLSMLSFHEYFRYQTLVTWEHFDEMILNAVFGLAARCTHKSPAPTANMKWVFRKHVFESDAIWN